MRPPGHDWRRTHAVVVAVERYATGGDGWDLDGPANDAARMMRWLRGLGVPEDQMHLLASPLERNEGLLAEFTGVRRSTADRQHVRRVFQDELRALDVDWLWVYWAGHGVQAAHNRWSLLYPESRDGDPQGVDAENLISLLRTDRLPARAAQRAVVVLDACRTTLRPGEQAHASEADPLTNRTEANVDRPLFVMRASRPGEAAKSVQGAGLFTSKVMDELEAGSRRDPAAAPDLDGVWGRIRRYFAEVEARDGAGQVPTVLCRNWDNDEDDYVPGRAPAPPATTNPARDRLALLVRAALVDGGPDLDRTAYRLGAELGTSLPCEPSAVDAAALVDWAMSRPHGVPTLIHVLAASERGVEPADLVSMKAESHQLAPGRWLLCGEYDALVALLDAQPTEAAREFAHTARKEAVGTDLTATAPKEVIDALEALLPDLPRLPRLLGTVERAAAAAGDGPYAKTLRLWSDGCARRLDDRLPAVLAVRRDAITEQVAAAGAADERVQIRLSAPSGPAGHRTYQVWTHGASGAESVEVRDTAVEPAEIERAVDTILARHGRVHSTPVEFFLDARDLELDVHRWQIRSDGPFERSLGAEFPVAVRCMEHRRPKQEHLWLGRWEQVARARTGDLHWLPGDLPTMKAAHGCVSARENAPGVVVAAVSPSAAPRTDVFTACVFGGVPVMVWCGHGEPERAAEELKEFLADCPLPELPARLRRLRAECDGDDTHPRGGLALLWDDPERQLPPRLDLSAP
ncbi:hypothetical protein AMK18_17095 [Streptomyces sp. CB01249]|uniref:VMAP-C domain-containing protein n=1 Tax=Streptomyces sp. CB01249 TaxID=1703929 RepID=UPI00093EB601|nr:caspase family protein [Streptomyces sp. CB01249]OKJ00365.1 hypothetical protein AMK18_17095 [Streptomyces sp. CB01249]